MTSSKMFGAFERRLANFNNSYEKLSDLPGGVTQHVIGVTASDGAASVGVLHKPANGRKVCAVYMHPRTNQTRPYLAPALLEAGISVWGQMGRHINNDIDMTHEEIIRDLSAGLRELREQGYETIVGIGNSGGSSLLAYYQSQASRPPEERQKASPAGELTGFDNEDMPPFDYYVALALHLGEGAGMQRMVDPAVVDEHDPVASDPALDMFDSRNGYRPFPEESRYDPEWLATYRAAQVARVRRLDSIARTQLEEYHAIRALADSEDLTSPLVRRALYARVMIVHRTAADPSYLDLRIGANRRPIGMIGDEHPIRVNYGFHGSARILTPRAWLSTWSGQSSRAELVDTIPHVKVPVLVVYPDADVLCSPEDVSEVMEACGSDDKTLKVIEWGTHYLTPAPGMPASLAPPKVRAGAAVVEWLAEKLG